MKGMLKEKLKKIASIIVVIAFVVQPINAEASQSKSGNYNSNYSLTGGGADKLVAVAQAQIGRTKAQMGYTEAWCADFVSDCAKLAGLSDIIPFDGYCLTLYNKVKNAGGQDVSTPQKGDLVFYYCSSCSVHWCHVGIMLDSQRSIEGNYGGKVSLVNGSYTDSNAHTLRSGVVTRRYVRPAYKNEVSPPQIKTWISTSPMGDVAGTFRSGEMYYLCYQLVDPDSGKLYNSVTSSTYTIKETIYSPDGTVANTLTYENSDNNWIGYQTRNSGMHKGVVEISGDFIGSSQVSYKIPALTDPKISVWFSDTAMGEKISELEKGKQYYLCYKIFDGNTNKLWNEVSCNSYKVEETFYKADGTEYSYTYTDSDNNWIRSVVGTAGKYKGVIKVSGDYNGEFEIEITLEDTIIYSSYFGDLDNDGKLTSEDVFKINKAKNGKIALTEDEKHRADLNGDGSITNEDLTLLQQRIDGSISEFPVETMLAEIKITKAPNKTSYYVGDTLSMEGMKVTAIYENGTKKEISNYQTSGNTNTAGKQNITISYTEGKRTRTTVQQIEVTEKHTHSYSEKVTKSATCTEEGVKTYSCNCGASYTRTIAMVSHNWDGGKITKTPTTTETGVKTYTCYTCGKTKEESVPVLEETELVLQKIEITQAPDKTCYYVGEELSMEGMQVTAIYNDGTKKLISNYKVSGNTNTVGIQNVIISYTEGVRTRTTRQQIEVIEKHTHSYIETITKSATCTEEGVRTYSCRCGASYTGTIVMLSHNWDGGKITKNPTTNETGIKTYTCYTCGRTKEESIPVLEDDKGTENVTHIHSYSEEIIKAATCVEIGVKTYRCSCGANYSRVIAMLNHNWDSGIITKNPTTSEQGAITYTCTICGTTNQEYIGMLEESKSADESEEVEESERVGESEDAENSEDDMELPETGDVITYKNAEYEVIKSTDTEVQVEYTGLVNPKVRKVSVPDTIKTEDGVACKVVAVSDSAFKNNQYIEKVTIGKNVTIIGKKAFYNCKKLKEIKLGSNVTSIGSSAFSKCTALTQLVLPANVRKIESNAFYGCKKLKKLVIKTKKLTAKNIGKKVMKGLSAKTVVYVPKSKLGQYKKLLRQSGLSSKTKILQA